MKWIRLNAFPIVCLVAAIIFAYGGFPRMAGWTLVGALLGAVKPTEEDSGTENGGSR